MKRTTSKMNTYAYKWIIPGCILFVVFFIVPTLMGVYYSFTFWDFRTARFAGLENYKNILLDRNLRRALTNTVTFSLLTTILKTSLGLLLAIFLNRQFRLKNYLRTVCFLPVIINNVAVGLIFSAILYPTGVLNNLLSAIGLDFLTQNWLIDPKIALFSVVGIEVWKWTGYSMIIFLAGLQAIDKSYYEAAEIDGASAFQRFRRITLPLIMPSFNNALIINLVGSMKVFDLVYATTKGGPGHATAVLNTMVYSAFSNARYGEASAGTVLLSIIVAVIAITGNNILRKKEVEM